MGLGTSQTNEVNMMPFLICFLPLISTLLLSRFKFLHNFQALFCLLLAGFIFSSNHRAVLETEDTYIPILSQLIWTLAFQSCCETIQTAFCRRQDGHYIQQSILTSGDWWHCIHIFFRRFWLPLGVLQGRPSNQKLEQKLSHSILVSASDCTVGQNLFQSHWKYMAKVVHTLLVYNALQCSKKLDNFMLSPCLSLRVMSCWWYFSLRVMSYWWYFLLWIFTFWLNKKHKSGWHHAGACRQTIWRSIFLLQSVHLSKTWSWRSAMWAKVSKLLQNKDIAVWLSWCDWLRVCNSTLYLLTPLTSSIKLL